MLEALRDLLNSVAKLFLGIFLKQAMQSTPIVNPPSPPMPIQPVPTPPTSPPPTPIGHPGPAPAHGGSQSKWWDARYNVTQDYGCTDFASEGHNPFHPECAYFHEGIDFGMPCGTPIYAGVSCAVLAIDPPGYGPAGNSAAIAIQVGRHTLWLYHMHDYAVKVNQFLPTGTLIGHSGTRGYSTGCHLHFEVRPNGAPYRHSVDPHFMLLHPEQG